MLPLHGHYTEQTQAPTQGPPALQTQMPLWRRTRMKQVCKTKLCRLRHPDDDSLTVTSQSSLPAGGRTVEIRHRVVLTIPTNKTFFLLWDNVTLHPWNHTFHLQLSIYNRQEMQHSNHDKITVHTLLLWLGNETNLSLHCNMASNNTIQILQYKTYPSHS